MKAISAKRITKQEREEQVLLGVVGLYLKEGRPIGSNTLRENGFDQYSSATIRNYFAKLEKEGFLEQPHSSGGRIPTGKAYQRYAAVVLESGKWKTKSSVVDESVKQLLDFDRADAKQVGQYLQLVSESLSEAIGYPTFLSAPRFDHDVVVDIKLVVVDSYRLLCILITDFGLVQTEVIYIKDRLSAFALKRIESYLVWKIRGGDTPSPLQDPEQDIAHKIYHEVMIRYIIGYANFSMEDIYQTGFSRLLAYPEFSEAKTFAKGLALFENIDNLRELLRETLHQDTIHFFIGDQLAPFAPLSHACSVVAMPYKIGGKLVGSIGILGPMRMPYRKIFKLLALFAQSVSETMTRSMINYKITYRQPESGVLCLEKDDENLVRESKQILIEDKRN